MFKLAKKVLEYELPIKVKPQKTGGFVVACPSWSDCYAQGDSIDEAILEITAVAQGLIELYKEEGLKVPLKFKSSKDFSSQFSVPVIVSG